MSNLSNKLNINGIKLNIVTAFDGWILPQIATNLGKHIDGCKVSDKPDMEADVNLYVNYHIFHSLGYPRSNFDIGYFTHKEPSKPFDQVASVVDHCIAMSKKTYELLPEGKRSVLSPCGADLQTFKNKPVTLGIVGKDHPGGRKGFDVVKHLESIDNVTIKITGGKLSKEQLVEFYDSIDYLLVTSTIEGGPVPILEAMRFNKPIIAPDVGWCWEFPVIRYETTEDLINIATTLGSPIISWEQSSQELVDIIRDIYKK